MPGFVNLAPQVRSTFTKKRHLVVIDENCLAVLVLARINGRLQVGEACVARDCVPYDKTRHCTYTVRK